MRNLYGGADHRRAVKNQINIEITKKHLSLGKTVAVFTNNQAETIEIYRRALPCAVIWVENGTVLIRRKSRATPGVTPN